MWEKDFKEIWSFSVLASIWLRQLRQDLAWFLHRLDSSDCPNLKDKTQTLGSSGFASCKELRRLQGMVQQFLLAVFILTISQIGSHRSNLMERQWDTAGEAIRTHGCDKKPGSLVQQDALHLNRKAKPKSCTRRLWRVGQADKPGLLHLKLSGPDMIMFPGSCSNGVLEDCTDFQWHLGPSFLPSHLSLSPSLPLSSLPLFFLHLSLSPSFASSLLRFLSSFPLPLPAEQI